MWILPKQLHTSAFVADTKALDLDSEEFSQICEKSLTWRGKDSVSRTWLQRWKRENWIQHLSSRTLNNSHTESFVDKWTSYLAASRANPSVVRDSVKLLKTPDTSSPTSQTESGSANLELFSLKTYKESSPVKQETESQFSNMSLESWKDWVTEQRQEYSQRKKLAHLTNASESLSWATPNICGNHNRKGASKTSGDGLSTQVKNWSTPTVMDTANIQKPRKKNPSGGQKPPLCQEVKNWPTPTTAEGTKIGNQPNFGQVGLSNHPSIVGHPDRAKLNKSGKSQESWSTPRETMSRDATYDRGKGNLGEVAQGKLNPDWVEHLMGLPVGWTQLPTEWIDLGSWETE